MIATPVLLSETPASVRTAAPLLGQDTDEVLQSLALTEDEINELRESKIIV